MKISVRNILLFVFNIFIIISTLIVSLIGIIHGAGSAQAGDNIIGLGYFKPFTMDSNILMGLIAAIYTIFLFKSCKQKKEMPTWVNVLYFVGVTSVSLTFLTVLFFLAPMAATTRGFQGYILSFANDLFFFHFANPVLSVICFFLMKPNKKIGWKENLIGIAPMFLYSLVYCLNVVILKNWNDFYGFTFGGKNYLVPLVMLTMYGITYLIGLILIQIQNRLNKK